MLVVIAGHADRRRPLLEQGQDLQLLGLYRGECSLGRGECIEQLVTAQRRELHPGHNRNFTNIL